MSAVGAAAAGVGLPAFMTEYSPNSPTMFDTAWLMNNALTLENVSAYIYWELVWNPTPPTGLVTIASPSPSSPYTINDTYYALKHFARWTDPGWVRVDATSSVLRGARVRVREPRRRQSHAGAPQHRREGPPGGGEPGGFSYGSLAVYRSSGDSERTAQVAPDSDGNILLPPLDRDRHFHAVIRRARLSPRRLGFTGSQRISPRPLPPRARPDGQGRRKPAMLAIARAPSQA